MDSMTINEEIYIKKSIYDQQMASCSKEIQELKKDLIKVSKSLYRVCGDIRSYFPLEDYLHPEDIPDLTHEQLMTLLKKYGIQHEASLGSEVERLRKENANLKSRNKILTNRLNERRSQYFQADISALERTIKLLQGLCEGMESSINEDKQSPLPV